MTSGNGSAKRSYGRREREIKLELIASIAKSQHALARILESVADVAGHSKETARLLGDNVGLLAALQTSMAEAVTELTVKKKVRIKGHPAGPWLNPALSRKQPYQLNRGCCNDDRKKEKNGTRKNGARNA